MRKALLLLGSNLGNRIHYLDKALDILNKNKETNIKNKSSFFESKAVGYDSSNSYFNIAVEIETSLSPQSLLSLCLETETTLSRTRSLTERYTDRTIDIDIILIDNLIINDANLIVPHPRMQERLFCLKPLEELASSWLVPTLKKTVKELLLEIENTSEVTKVNVEV